MKMWYRSFIIDHSEKSVYDAAHVLQGPRWDENFDPPQSLRIKDSSQGTRFWNGRENLKAKKHDTSTVSHLSRLLIVVDSDALYWYISFWHLLTMDRQWPLSPSRYPEYEWDGNRGWGLRGSLLITYPCARLTNSGCLYDEGIAHCSLPLYLPNRRLCMALHSTVICGHAD